MNSLLGVSVEDISAVVGYAIAKGDFSTKTPYLPQSVVILAEGNDANQSSFTTDAVQITTAQKAGQLFGYGSPVYGIMRILQPVTGGGGLGGIPITVIPQKKASGATPAVFEITPAGVANNNGTHYLVIGGRRGLDGTSYAINIKTGDTTDDITQKISDVVNGVLGCPVNGAYTEYEASLQTKWSGLTANDLTVSVDTGNDDLGLTYTVNKTQTGSGTPSIAVALSQFQNNWHTLVINSYGLVSSVMDALEAFNGIPDETNPTGRYTGIVMKPFHALSGSLLDDPSSITDSRADQVTIAVCPAPGSAAFGFEAAANVCAKWAVIAQNSPHLDMQNIPYPDMPAPLDSVGIGSMGDYDNRNAIMQKGCSTVSLVGGKYVMEDFVTTYHPDGEIPPQFRYVRNLNIDWNVRFMYLVKETASVKGHTIAADDDVVSVGNVVKPKIWKGVLFDLADTMTSLAIITEAQFMKDSIDVELDGTNPDRLDTNFSYKRTGFGRVLSTTATAGFSFGTGN